jgi:hypothetical protein
LSMPGRRLQVPRNRAAAASWASYAAASGIHRPAEGEVLVDQGRRRSRGHRRRGPTRAATPRAAERYRGREHLAHGPVGRHRVLIGRCAWTAGPAFRTRSG